MHEAFMADLNLADCQHPSRPRIEEQMSKQVCAKEGNVMRRINQPTWMSWVTIKGQMAKQTAKSPQSHVVSSGSVRLSASESQTVIGHHQAGQPRCRMHECWPVLDERVVERGYDHGKMLDWKMLPSTYHRLGICRSCLEIAAGSDSRPMFLCHERKVSKVFDVETGLYGGVLRRHQRDIY